MLEIINNVLTICKPTLGHEEEKGQQKAHLLQQPQCLNLVKEEPEVIAKTKKKKARTG